MRELNVSEWQSFKILLYRDYLNSTRNPLLTKMRLIAILFGSMAAGLVFIRLTGDYTNRVNWLSTLGAVYCDTVGIFLMAFLPVTLSFPLQRTVFLKEENSKLYSTYSYFMSRNIIDLPYTFLTPLLGAMMVYWISGLSNTPTQFFTFLLVLIGATFAGSGVGLLIGSMVTDAKSMGIAIPLIMEPFMLFAGYFKNLKNLPPWIGWYQYLSPFKYGFAALLQNEVQFGNAPFLENLNFNTDLWLNIGMLFTLGIGFRILSFYFLWKLRTKVQ